MEYNNIIYEVRENIGLLTINRPKSLNALNSETISEIKDVLAKIKDDNQIRVLILTGSGEKAFAAGADVTEFVDIGLKEGFNFSRKGQHLNRDLEELDKPVIAAVNGLALGGGCELVLSSTFRILSENAKLGLPELGLGVIPGYGGTQRLAKIIGKSRALWIMLTGDLISAEEALQMGLANMVVKQGELLDAAINTAKKIIQKAPLAVKMAMVSVNYGTEASLETGLALEGALSNVLLGSEDKKEGVASFIEKRKPIFTGK